ncbi:hypothetical protein OCU04_006260 [Sclerotinia nivalis]|uniref:LPXTG-motif cell wall anchor domain protein n=1 Tax=Sclerotinia nivalis TaxID=352851 RepID=A0A9X0DL17_9HELO|nr:hypothetical protein OCU04_006260 [Sclerotinia nivalis]
MSQIPQSPNTRSKPRPRPLSFHSHRVDHNSSKLPRIRYAPDIITQIPTTGEEAAYHHHSTLSQSADSNMATANTANTSIAVNSNMNAEENNNNNNLKLKSSSFDLKFTGNHSTVATPFSPTNPNKKEPFRTRILNSFTGGPVRSGSPKSSSSRRTLSYPTPTPNRASVTTNTSTKLQHETASRIVASEKNARRVPAHLNGKNGITAEVTKESTSTMLSSGASYVSQTTNWIADQSHLDQTHSPSTSYAPRSSLENTPSRPVLLPARGIKNNNKMEPDLTERESALRSLEGRNPRKELPDERNSDEADLFLQVAQEEDDMNRQRNPAFNRLDSRKSRIGMRQSLPAPNFRSSYFRREADQETKPTARYAEEAESLAQVLGDNSPARTGPATSTTSIPNEQRKRSYATAALSNPTTPRTNNREGDFEPQSYAGRRPSIQDRTITAYRQSNLSTSYSVPRTTTYHSSPLVAQPMEIGEQHETQRAIEGTASTVSTTAPSTVWDELDDLKSRIHRLELTGKLPTTSGAAVSRATHERPPTAATTETTMSTSPKRGRGNSISPTEAPSVDVSKAENHPLLRSALLNSKPLLDPEIYKSLEATANDALAISAMMGTSGQPGPISSSQSSIGGAHSNFSDRQVRRKADSLCRSLTELCLSLSERRSNDHDTTLTQLRQNVRGQDVEIRQTIEPVSPRQPPSSDIAKLKASPRSYSRLEARRSTLLATNTLPTLRYPPPENTTPTQSLAAGRRTSLLLRSRRAETEDPQETVEARFRAPSRAKTDVGRRGEIPREEMPRPHFPEDDMRSGTATSSLALRRSYTTALSPNRGPQPSPLTQINTGRRYYERTPEREILVNSSLGGSGGGRRYLERTPERDTTSLSGRLAEERGQRKVSAPLGLGARNRAGSLMRSKDPLGPSQSGAYQ